jgi:glutamate-ammonia-ligase adenylyltransferase
VHEESAEEDIKRGRGGLREVEFIIQTFQLLKGGKDRRLQTPDLYQAVKMIAAEEWLPRAQVMQLQQDYDVLRTVEDSIQMIADRQTQLYPNNDLDQARLAWVMGYANWQEFVTKLAPMRKRINQQFSQLFYTPKTTSTQPELNEMFSKLWHAQVSIVTWAIQAGKETSQVWERCDTVLQTFRDSHQITRLSKEAQIRLDQLMPLVLAIIVEQKDPDVYLQRFLQVISAIVRRSTYLSLLIENSDALLHLIQCCGQSIWLSDQLSQYPILLDSLLDQRLSLLSLDKDALENRLEQALLATPEEDTEAQLEILRQHKNEYTLQATKAYLTAQLDDDALGICLSQCAEAFLNVIARLAWRWVAVKYNLQEGDDINIPPWAIVAYGKLGGKEMGFQSDLDIVFLYDNGAALELEVTLQQQRAEYSYQWARRVVYWLELKTYNGYLYKVDTQLRPSGQAGLLVSDIVHFKTYQLEQAWLWEHQALLRARVVASCGQMATQFAHIRHQVLAQNRPIDKLQQEIVAMRQRMQMHQATIPKEKFDIKQGQGGLIDVEFMIQFLSLSTLRQETERLSYTSHREWLQWVSNLGTIDNKTGAVLLAIYHYYRQQLNQAALQNAPSWVDEESMQEKRAIAQQIWQMLFARGDHDE